ncbi:MAG TPA: LexA family transcriptional regulator [Thermoanaerobaculia bacterium]|nr:LexA family transcriptional regulator [Thermoanaerobaculia bacterium]
MRIGERLGLALKRAGKKQVNVAFAAGLDPAALSKIISGEIEHPRFDTIEKIVRAADLTWAEVFDEPRLRLSPDDVRSAREFQEVLERILENDSKQKDISRTRGFYIVSDAPRGTSDEVENLPTQKIPDEYQRLDANRAYLVHTDAMIEARIPEESVIYARATQNVASADGEIVVCRLNGKLYLRRLDLRGNKTVLVAANPRYGDIVKRAKDRFALEAMVRMLD